MGMTYDEISINIRNKSDIDRILSPIRKILSHIIVVNNVNDHSINYCHDKIRDVLDTDVLKDTDMIVTYIYVNDSKYAGFEFRPAHDMMFGLFDNDKESISVGITYYSSLLRVDYTVDRDDSCLRQEVSYNSGLYTDLYNVNLAITDIVMPRLYNKEMYDLLDVLDY